MTVLHIAVLGPITKCHFSFLEEHLDCTGHQLLSRSDVNAWPALKTILNISTPNKYSWLVRFLAYANRADKIVIHGLWSEILVLALASNPWVLRRCYWVIWGADLYLYNQRIEGIKSYLSSILRRFVIQRMGHLVTYIDGDVALARQWWGAKGRHHECIMYMSNVYQKSENLAKQHKVINILVGNSADPANNHFEVFDRLMSFQGRDIAIYVPLSYGDPTYAKSVIEEGVKRFGNKFEAITEILPFNEYVQLLNKMDIAVFNHRLQQAMGNTITLLGLGKKVYLRSDVAQWALLKKYDLAVFDVSNITMQPLDAISMRHNQEIIMNVFSKKNLLAQLMRIYED